MSGQESSELALIVLFYAAQAVGVAFIPWLLHRGTEKATLWLGLGAAVSATVGTAVLMFLWSSGDAWVGLYAGMALFGSCLLAVAVAAVGTLIAVLDRASNKQRMATFRAAAALVFILVLALAVLAGPILYDRARTERFETRIAELALKPPPPGVSLEEIEIRLTRAGQSAIEQARAGDEPTYNDFNLELVRLWHPANKLVHFAEWNSEWDAKMLEDDALLMQAVDEEASEFLLSVTGTGGFGTEGEQGSFEVIERWSETRERAEPSGISYYGSGYRVDGPQGTTQLFENYKFRRIVFKLSEGAAADAKGYKVYHVYVTSPDGVNWYVVGLKDYFRTP
ncbi:MAG: hypothetical protein U1E26_03940 [Coriobacteriia bacterium]|nr:hypothetical protein [Coriobacteriia bacterium]